MIDIRPATERMAALLSSLHRDDLARPTPCPDTSLGDLVDHVGSLSRAFTAAANKELGALTARPPAPSAANLTTEWCDRVTEDLRRLADAWDQPEAWQGMTGAGGVPLPGEVAGVVVLDELVVHGWDIAVAADKPFEAAAEDIEASAGFITSFDPPRDGSLFGPVVRVPDDAPPLVRLLGLAGRDPGWRPPDPAG